MIREPWPVHPTSAGLSPAWISWRAYPHTGQWQRFRLHQLGNLSEALYYLFKWTFSYSSEDVNGWVDCPVALRLFVCLFPCDPDLIFILNSSMFLFLKSGMKKIPGLEPGMNVDVTGTSKGRFRLGQSWRYYSLWKVKDNISGSVNYSTLVLLFQ
jgi:hypothetical protein